MIMLAEVGARLAAKTGVNPSFANQMVCGILDVFADALAAGEVVHLGSFGELRVREVEAHETVHPQDRSRKVHIPSWRKPYLVSYRKLLQRMNPHRKFK